MQPKISSVNCGNLVCFKKVDMKSILVYVEQQNGRLAEVSLEILGKARHLALQFNGQVSAIVIGDKCQALAAELISYGANRVFIFEDSRLKLFQADVYTTVLCRLVAQIRPDMLLMGDTFTGSEIAPAAAARFRTGLISHCIDIQIEMIDNGDQLILIVPGLQANTRLKIICPDRRPIMATIRPGIMDKATQSPGNGKIIKMDLKLQNSDFRIETLGFFQEDDQIRLNQARIIVSGGFGFFEAGGTDLLKQLASAFGGAVAGSRPACDSGWIPEECMIGQSGISVRPDLFISIGASGSPHYTTGFSKSKIIAAIDRNPSAPIFDLAHVGIVGDLREIIPALIHELKQEKNEN